MSDEEKHQLSFFKFLSNDKWIYLTVERGRYVEINEHSLKFLGNEHKNVGTIKIWCNLCRKLVNKDRYKYDVVDEEFFLSWDVLELMNQSIDPKTVTTRSIFRPLFIQPRQEKNYKKIEYKLKLHPTTLDETLNYENSH